MNSPEKPDNKVSTPDKKPDGGKALVAILVGIFAALLLFGGTSGGTSSDGTTPQAPTFSDDWSPPTGVDPLLDPDRNTRWNPAPPDGPFTNP